MDLIQPYLARVFKKKKKCPPKGTFYKSQQAGQGIKITHFSSAFTIRKIKLNSRPCKNSLEDFCTSESLTICFFRSKEVNFSVIFRAFRNVEVQKYIINISHGLDLSSFCSKCCPVIALVEKRLDGPNFDITLQACA